jgi:hypothetical protein
MAMNHVASLKQLTTAKVRLSDSAVYAGSFSLLYGLAVVVFPDTLSKLFMGLYAAGHFFPAIGILLLAWNEILFVVIARRRIQKPNFLTCAYIAFLTVAFVLVFRAVVVSADAQAQLAQVLVPISAQGGIRSEELLVYSHLGLVSGTFLPYLLLRMTQSCVSGANPAEVNLKVQHTAAGQ